VFASLQQESSVAGPSSWREDPAGPEFLNGNQQRVQLFTSHEKSAAFPGESWPLPHSSNGMENNRL
jgi:hypothetical protein